MKKILCFEDDPFMGDMYKKIFEKGGFNVQHYEYPPKDKDELINLVLAENPDIILTDIIHPAPDGFQMTEILKSNEKTKHIPIVALTNLSQKEDIKRGMDLGMSDYLVNSYFTPTEVVDRLKGILD